MLLFALILAIVTATWLLAGILLRKVVILMATVADIQAKVTDVRGKQASLIALTNEIAQVIRDNANDPAALAQIANDLDAAAADLQTAINANSDVDPTP